MNGITVRWKELVEKLFLGSTVQQISGLRLRLTPGLRPSSNRASTARAKKMAEESNPMAPTSTEELDSDLDGIDLTLGPDEVEMSPGALEDFRREAEVTFFALVPEEGAPAAKASGTKPDPKRAAPNPAAEMTQKAGGMTIEDLLAQLD